MIDITEYEFTTTNKKGGLINFAVDRREDGYWNATKMCQAFGKQFAQYSANAKQKELIHALSVDLSRPKKTENLDIGNPTSKPGIVDVFTGRPANLQGTWIHPELAIDLAQWLNVQFRIKLNRIINGFMFEGKQLPRAVSADHLSNEEYCAGLLKRMNRVDKLADDVKNIEKQMIDTVREKDAEIYNLESQVKQQSEAMDRIRRHSFKEWKDFGEKFGEDIDQKRLEKSKGANVIEHGLFRKKDNGGEEQ